MDLQNCRGLVAADFAKGQSIPSFLQAGLHGNPGECRKVFQLVLADSFVEM